MDHIKRCASTWRYTRSEILAHAAHQASLDPYQLSRLPELMQAEIEKHKATRKEAA